MEDKLKEHLLKIYERHEFELRGNKEKALDATMSEISLMINRMMDSIWNQAKKDKRI